MSKRITTLCLASAVFWVTAGNARAQSVDRKVMQLEHEWADAYVKSDAAAIERLEAADYVFTGPDGSVSGKPDDVDHVKSGNFKAEAIDLDDLKAHVYGKAAIVTGKAIFKNSKEDGKDISGSYRFTDVWADTNGQWQVVASQLTALAKQ